MSRVFVTGDKHACFESIYSFIELYDLTEEDTIIVLGDMGLFWRKDKQDSKFNIENYEKNYKTNLWFICGNHENHPQLRELELDEQGLGYISEHIRYIPRGTVFELNGKTFLGIGGAESVDKCFRIPELSWWKEETITEEDIQKCIKNVDGRHIDYILSHTCPRSCFESNKVFLCTMNLNKANIDHTSEDRLEELKNAIEYGDWWFAHFHIDADLNDNFHVLFHQFKEI